MRCWVLQRAYEYEILIVPLYVPHWRQRSMYQVSCIAEQLSKCVTRMPEDDGLVPPLQVARTSTGVYVSSRLSGRDSEADEEEPHPSIEVDELLCVTVDACGRYTARLIAAGVHGLSK